MRSGLRNGLMKNLKIEGVDSTDYPDFCDSYISYAEHDDGTPLTEDELETLTEEHPEIAQELAFESLIGE